MKRKKQSIAGWLNACRIGQHYFCSGSSSNKKCACPCHDALVDKVEPDLSKKMTTPFSLVLFRMSHVESRRVRGRKLIDDTGVVAATQTAERLTCAVCKDSMKYIAFCLKGEKGEKETRIDFAVCARAGCEYWKDISEDKSVLNEIMRDEAI